MSLAVISYPKFIPNEGGLIPVTRAIYPKLTYPKFESHFTFVFPQASVSAEVLTQYVQAVAMTQTRIPFVIRRAEAMRDSLSANTYLFFVPDEGYEAVIQLHDGLYTGVLAAELRADILFIPHITIGYTADNDYCQQVAAELNAKNFEVRGTIDRLDVVQLEGDSGKTVAQIGLR
ncbi:MAG: 2'-5' RNA ligase family protein [Chloroflexota bacterium]